MRPDRPLGWDRLRPYQKDAAISIAQGTKQGLFAGAGLGKTAISLAAAWLRDGGYPWLIVTRAIGRHVWPRDARWVLGHYFIPGMLWAGKAQSKHGIHQDGSYTSLELALTERLGIVTNYDVLGARLEELLEVPWKVLIFDESHYLKGGYLPPQYKRDGTLSRTRWHHARDLAIEVHARGGLVLPVTATPIANWRNDLWSQLDLAFPGEIYANRVLAENWLRRLNRERTAQGLSRISYKLVYESSTGKAVAWGKYGPALIYSEVEAPSAESISFLRRYCNAQVGAYGGVESFGEAQTDELRQRLTQDFVRVSRKQVAEQLPLLQRDVRPITPTSEPTMFLGGGYENALARAAMVKHDPAIELMLDYATAGEKVVIATNRRKLAYMLFEAVQKAARGLPKKIQETFWADCVTGDTPIPKRVATLQAFNESKRAGCMVVTMDSVSETINLHFVNAAIVTGLPIKPKLIEQFEGRFGRLGGVPCVIHYLVAEGTIDEKIRIDLLDKLSNVCKTGTDTGGIGSAEQDLRHCRNEEEIIGGLRSWLNARGQE